MGSHSPTLIRLVKSGRHSTEKTAFLIAFLGHERFGDISILNTAAAVALTMPRPLKRDEIAEELKRLHGWRARGAFITKAYDFEQFTDGIRFVNMVADIAEKLEHHPDINVRYTRVGLSIQTHSAGGVTKWDFQLARAIDKLDPKSQKGS